MNKELFKKLCMNYNKSANKELYDLWSYNLRPYSNDEIEEAINIIVGTDKFFPTLSRVLEVIKEVVKHKPIENSETVVREKMKKHNIHPKWLDKFITNEPLDEETEKEFNDFQDFLKEIRE